ncbi:MAG: sugar ABC transporter substrate-binding protein [bacterium]|nr:sugar ABC transporter substrate-binding protein [bacterium]
MRTITKTLTRKTVSAGLCLAMAAALAACSGGSNTTNTTAAGTSEDSSTTTASGEQVTLRFAFWGASQQEVSQQLADAFHEKYPNITVEIEYTPQNTGEYWTKLESSATGGSAPDVFWMNGVHADDYIEGGMMLPLTEMVENSTEIDWENDFPKTLTELYSREGEIYAIPKDFDTNAVWYNKTLFDNAGLEYPTSDWTWEEMVETARKLTDTENGIYGITADFGGQQYYYNTISAAGGYILADDYKSSGYDDPNTIQGLQCWVDLIEEGLSPTLEQMTDTSTSTLFESGRLAMIWAGSWNTATFMKNEQLNGNVDVVELPSFNGNKGNCINGVGIGVYANTKYPEEAKLFAEWMGSKEGQEVQGKSGTVISARYDCQSLYTKAFPELNLQAYLNQVDVAMPYPCCKITNQMLTVESDYLKQAYTGQLSVEDACKAIAAEVNPMLEKAYQ